MDEGKVSNVIDFNLAKQLREDQKEIERACDFELEVTGQLCFDSIDDLIAELEDQGLNVQCFIYPEEQKPLRAND